MSNTVRLIAVSAALVSLMIDPASSQNGASTVTLNADPGRAAEAPSGVSLFSSSNTPAQTKSEGRPLEVGVKFTSSVAGQIIALKFYRSPGDTGPNLLDLWTSTGTKLASARFFNIRASGWQTVPLQTPVTIAANTTYIVSYHTNGVYAATNNFFTDAVPSGTLSAPSCDNGVYSYGGTSTTGIFPTSTFNATNYFADVVFSSSETPPPVTSYPGNQRPLPPPSDGVIPADRLYAWNPGLMSKGGIPDRTTICATLSPGANIQAALNSCPMGQVVQLNEGTYTVNNYLLMHSGITLRGAGAGQTILKKTNGAPPRLSKLISGSDYIHAVPPDANLDPQPILILGPQRWPTADNTSSQNLIVDGMKDASSVTLANAGSCFAAGQFVLLDEKSGASWKPTGVNYPDNGNINPATPVQVWAGDRVWWQMHLPHQEWIDDSGNANSAGPYDNTPGQLPGAMRWFSRSDRPINEIKEIASVSGNTVTFTSPLTISYRVSHQAQLTRYSGANRPVVMAGVENLSMFGGSDGELQFKNCAYCWARNVEVAQFAGHGIDIIGSFRNEIRDSYIHTASWPRPGGGAYLLALTSGSSEALIENNILIDANKQMVANSAGAGSVVRLQLWRRQLD